jgi:hypothetical protein
MSTHPSAIMRALTSSRTHRENTATRACQVRAVLGLKNKPRAKITASHLDKYLLLVVVMGMSTSLLSHSSLSLLRLDPSSTSLGIENFTATDLFGPALVSPQANQPEIETLQPIETRIPKSPQRPVFQSWWNKAMDALFEAAKQGNPGEIRKILSGQDKPDVNAGNEKRAGCTALHYGMFSFLIYLYDFSLFFRHGKV